jgi:hypothetical protein
MDLMIMTVSPELVEGTHALSLLGSRGSGQEGSNAQNTFIASVMDLKFASF